MNRASLDLIKEFEGLRLTAYQDSVGVWTIGYGTTAKAGVGIEPKAGMKITEGQAEAYLQAAIDKFAAQIAPKITRPTTANQFGAMVSLAYNIGPSAFGKSSVLRLFNDGEVARAADAFRLWNKAGGKVLAGLTRRREAERALFLKPDQKLDAPPLSPKPVDASKAPQVVINPTEPRHPTPSLFGAVLALLIDWIKNLLKGNRNVG